MRPKLQEKTREITEVWKWLAYKDNAIKAMDVDKDSQGETVKGLLGSRNGKEPTKSSQLKKTENNYQGQKPLRIPFPLQKHTEENQFFLKATTYIYLSKFQWQIQNFQLGGIKGKIFLNKGLKMLLLN